MRYSITRFCECLGLLVLGKTLTVFRAIYTTGPTGSTGHWITGALVVFSFPIGLDHLTNSFFRGALPGSIITFN